MRVAVLGGTGCGGRAVVAALRAHGHTVASLARGEAKGPAPDLRCDRGDADALRAALETAHPEVLIDHVGYRPEEVALTLEVLPSSVRRYVFVSSAAIYGPGRAAPYVVGEEPRPHTPFTQAKRAAELVAQGWSGGQVVVPRLGGLYGPGHAPLTPWGRAEDLFERLRGGLPVPVPTEGAGRLQPWFSGDHGGALGSLSVSPHPPAVVHLAGGETLTWPAVLALWAEVLGAPPVRVELAAPHVLLARTPATLRPFLPSLLDPPVLEVPEALPFTAARIGFAHIATTLRGTPTPS